MLILTETDKEKIVVEAEQGYPEEICGFLVGTVAGSRKTVTQIVPITNQWDDSVGASRRSRFAIPSEEYYRVDRQSQQQGKAILGFYHSHPDSPARPSEYDLQMAQAIFPGYSYIIVSVIAGTVHEMTAWVLRDDSTGFDPETIQFLKSVVV